jgi:hypothetical protein
MSSLINNAKINVLPVEQLGPGLELEQSLPPGNKKYILIKVSTASTVTEYIYSFNFRH